MPLNIFNNPRKVGVHTNRIDKEPYFDRWVACIPMGSADQLELIGVPCYKHKTCGHLVKVSPSRIPPRICPWCNRDTIKEVKDQEIHERNGVKFFDFPQKIVTLKEAAFDSSWLGRKKGGNS